MRLVGGRLKVRYFVLRIADGYRGDCILCHEGESPALLSKDYKFWNDLKKRWIEMKEEEKDRGEVAVAAIHLFDLFIFAMLGSNSGPHTYWG